MIKEILPDLYQIEVPIPKNPLKALNSYVVKGGDRNLIIDTGVNQRQAAHIMFSSLTKIGIDLDKTDLFSTHLHVDHLGLAAKLATESSKMYFNQPEAACVNSTEQWRDVISVQEIFATYCVHGFPPSGLKRCLMAYPGYDYATGRKLNVCLVKDGDRIEVGDYSFICIETPGHSFGHICLYEPRHKVLVAGDHLLFDVTPNVSSFMEKGNPLRDYIASLDKVYPLEVKLVLPGHREIFEDHKKRIREIKQHHQVRIQEVLDILGKEECTAFSVAPQMTWAVDCESWEELSLVQKLVSFGEALAHLRFLEEEEVISRKTKRGKVVFFRD